MNESSLSDINKAADLPLKKPWLVGPHTLVVIDKNIVKKLEINEENTLLQQEVTEGGIFLRIIRIGNNTYNDSDTIHSVK